MRGKELSNDKWDKIIRFVAKGNSKEDILSVFDLPSSSYAKVVSVIGAAQRNDIEQLRRYMPAAGGAVRAACRHYAIDLELLKDKPEPEPIPKPVPVQTVIPEVVPMADSDTKVYLAQLLQATKEQNELLRDLIDAVIPKYVQDLTDAIDSAVHDSGEQMEETGKRVANRIVTMANTNTDLIYKQNEQIIMGLQKLRK